MDWTVKSSVEGSGGGGGGGGGAMVEVVNKRRRMERNILWNSSRLSSREVSALYCTAVGYQYLASPWYQVYRIRVAILSILTRKLSSPARSKGKLSLNFLMRVRYLVLVPGSGYR